MKVFDGGVDEAVNFYTKGNISELTDHVVASDKYRKFPKSKELEYIDIRMLNDVYNVANQETLAFEMIFRRNNVGIKECQLGITSRNSNDVLEWVCYSSIIPLPQDKDTFKVKMSIPNHNTPMGRHKLNFSISNCDYASQTRDYDILTEVISFEVKYIDVAHNLPFAMWSRREGTSIHNSRIELI